VYRVYLLGFFLMLALARCLGCASYTPPPVFSPAAHEGGFEPYRVIAADVRFETPPPGEAHQVMRYWVQSDETGYTEGQPSEGPDPTKAPEEVSSPTYWTPLYR
jgi:hypothetical protein